MTPQPPVTIVGPFERNLREIINKYSMENFSDTPDHILAAYMMKCLEAFNTATRARSDWYDCDVSPSKSCRRKKQ